MKPEDLTPIEYHDGVWLKRDDLFSFANIRGGKVRTCLRIATEKPYAGLITASARKSPQAQIVARIAHSLGIPARCHTPEGAYTPEMDDAVAHGAEIIQHGAGYNNVIIARANADLAEHPGWCHVPFGMEHPYAVEATAEQVANMKVVSRIVVPVGSGMTAAGILHGLARWGAAGLAAGIPVLGVVVGADPTRRLDRYAPPMWRGLMRLVPAGQPYHVGLDRHVGGVRLDPVYEAKCVDYLQTNDCLWCVGIRAGLT